MRWKKARLGDICTKVVTGKTPPTSVTEYFDGSIKWITPSDFDKKELVFSNRSITQKAIDENKAPLFPPNSILINCIGNIGKVGILRTIGSSNQQITAIKLAGEVDVDFFYYQLLLKKDQLINLGNNSVVPILNSTSLKRLEVSFPDLPTQQHIAAVLDKADALCQQNQQLLTYYDELLQGTFIELFGDPVTNEKGWEVKKLGEVAAKFKDGPFGSNLKTEHYQEIGIRVIRLGNIGVGEFLNEKEAYISQEHFENVLSKYKCVAGDVIIGTMGEPNLRACILPKEIEIAVNKADCIQFRPKAKEVNTIYISALLNQPGTLILAGNMMHGQTRVRISMGQLKDLLIPIPPLALQNQFAEIVERIEAQKAQAQASLTESEALFEGLLEGYFGENQIEMKGSNPGPPTSQLRLF